jgi:hypothetical protein
MSKFSCTIWHEGKACGKPAVGGLISMLGGGLGFYCLDHINSHPIVFNVSNGRAISISLEEAVVHEVMTS